ncbi:MAG: DNA-protecting protein DprA [Azonexus sp.]|jgi:DNA processing protein|nr:DNA-protecting protein DprA [Azonexus sp.]
MKYSENAINVMAARIYKGIGRAWIVNNLSTPKPENTIVQLLNESPKFTSELSLEDFNKKKSALRRILAESEDAIDGVVAIGDDDFPPHRGSVKNSERPIFLFYRGDLSLLSANSKNVAVIGLLNPSREIETVERKLVSGLVMNGAVIVSGLALGCDSIAHLQTLDSNGKTVAILPSPLSDIMPTKNRGLADTIVANGGLLISEYLTAPKSKMELNGRYQERDRLQALFSNSIVLSASYAKNDIGNDSGSRLAMSYAKDYSIPRAVIYDQEQHLSNPMFDLNRQIIREGPDVVIFNERNSASSLPKILRANPIVVGKNSVQQSLI